MTEIKIKLLRPGARLPEKATEGSAGYDLYLPETVTVRDRRAKIPLGFAMLLPPGLCAKIRPRSGQSAMGMSGHQCTDCSESSAARFDCDSCTGLIDSDYRGEVHIILHKRDYRTMTLKAGIRIAQMTIEQVPPTVLVETTDDLPATPRGDGGFEHSGTQTI